MHTSTKINQILQLVQQHQQISIKTLSSSMHLSIPYVTAQVEELLKEGLLCEKTQEVVSSGRKPKLYSLNPEYGYMIGIDMGLINTIRVGFLNFAGALFNHFSVSFCEFQSGEDVIRHLIDSISAKIAAHDLTERKLLSIVIGNPGVIDKQTGSIHRMSAESAMWEHLPLRKIFEDAFNTHIIVLNDVNLCAIGEQVFGLGKGYRNFLFIRNEIGLKAGVVINDRLYQGEAGAAGEIGLNVMFARPFPQTQNFRAMSVESLLSMNAIYKVIISELPNHPDDPFYATVNGDPAQVNAANIAKVLGGTSFIDQIISERGRLFGLVLVNAITTLDIALVIISGDLARLNNFFFKPMRDAMAEHLIAPPTILTASLGDDAAFYGAYGVSMEYICEEQSRKHP